MAKETGEKGATSKESPKTDEVVQKQTSEDLSVEAERDALKKAREADAVETGSGGSEAAHGNLHFGEQQTNDIKNVDSTDFGENDGSHTGQSLNNEGARGRQNAEGARNDGAPASTTAAAEDSEAVANSGNKRGESEFSGRSQQNDPQSPSNNTQNGPTFSGQDAEDDSNAGQPEAGLNVQRTPVNEAPTDIEFSNSSVDENAAGATVATLSFVDPDADETVEYTITDDTSGLFEIVGNELRLKDGVSLDHEAQDSYTLNIQAQDSAGNFYSESVEISVSDINETPLDISLSNSAINENEAGAVVGTLSTIDPDSGDSISYVVSDDRFEIVGNELRVKAGVSFDHEAADLIDVSVTATDSGGLSRSETFTIDIEDINEGPSNVQLTNSAIDENDNGAVVGTLYAYDPDAGDTISYTVSDDRFEVVGDELRVKSGISFDHETVDAIDVMVTAIDSGGLSYDQNFVIDINDINEGPSNVQLTNTAIDENVDGAVVGTLSAYDPDVGDTISYTVSDDRFEVVGDELRVKAGVSFNHETVDAIDVTVTATDSGGLTSDQIFTIDINDINEGPSNVQLTNTAIDENVDGAVVGTLSAVDPDAGDTITYTVSDDRFEVVGDELRVKAGVSFNHETVDAIDVTVTATDSGGLNYNQGFTIDINDINEGPSNVQLTNTAIDENVDGAVVGTLSAVDPDAGDTITYTVSDDRFEVVGDELRVKAGISFDHETVDAIDVTVTATDSGGLTSDQSFTIDINDINEGPSNVQLTNSAIDENVDGALVGTLSAYDPDAGDTITYTVSDDRFEVVGDELRVKAGVSFDHETIDAIDLTVTATDTGGLTSDQDFTIDINDINEGPSDVQLSNTAIDENVDGAVVGTLSAYDPDAGDTITYAVSDDRFEVVGDELRVKAGVSFDHETVDAVDVTVTATDTGGLNYAQDFTIDINDINEGPSDVQLTNTSVDENVDGAVVGTLSAVDPDAGDTISYTVSDDRFEVVGNELRVKAGVSFDHETVDAIDITVTATDSGGLTSDQGFTIDISDINEDPSDIQLTNTAIDENVDGAVVGTLSAYDPDAGDTISYTVSDDRFEVVGDELRVKAGISFDHETVDAIDVTVTATDSGGLNYAQDFTIDINDINEGPSNVQLTNTAVDENVDGAAVGTLSAVDPDAGDTITYAVSDDRFEVVGNELRVKAGVSFDHETVDSIDLTVTATDSGGLTTDQDFTIDINDINEAPVDLTLTQSMSVAEADFSAGDGHSGSSVERLGLETDAIVFTMSFTTSADVDAVQTLFETGGSVYGTNVVIQDGMLEVYAGEGNDLELSVPVNGDTEYSFALELDKSSDTIRVLLSDELPLSQMTAGNSLVATVTDWNDRDYTGSNGMAVGNDSGNAQGYVGGDFRGEIAAPGLQIFSDSTFDDVLTEAGTEENSAGAVVGTLSSFDPDAGDTVTYTVSDDRFEVVGNELRLVDGQSLDHEAEPIVDITVTATDSGGLSTTETFSVDVIDMNEGPTDLALDGNSVDENSTDGVIGTVSVSDPDVGDTHTYKLVDNDGLPVSIDAQTGVISIASPDMPGGSVLHIDASDADSLTIDDGVSNIQDLSGTGNSITQNDGPEQPVLTSDGPFGEPGLQFDGDNDYLHIADDSTLNLSTYTERSFALTIQTGDDVDSRQVVFEEGGTVNGFNFYIDDGQLYMGAWSDSNGWSFEAVSVDVDPGSSYSIISVFDGATNTYTAYVNGENVGSVDVGDAMSAHSGDIGLGGIAQHTVFHDGSSSAGTGFNFDGSIGEFAIYNEALESADVTALDMNFRGINAEIDFESKDSYDLTIEVTDAGGESYQEVFTIDVNDLNEGPVDIQLTNTAIDENIDGAVVGTLSAVDPDAGDSISYTVSDDRFEVVGNELRVKAGVSFDHETTDAVDVTVTATDSGGLTSDQDFTVDINDINEGPNDVQLTNTAIDENVDGAVVGTLSAVDPDAGDSFSYTVSDDRFEVVGNELRVKAGVSFDHETTDAVDVTVTATDSGGLTSDQDFTVDINDINEGPSDVQLTNTAIDENIDGAVVGTLSAVDPDAGDSISYTVSDDRFEVVGNELRVKAGVSFDHETTDAVDVTVTATDSGGLTSDQDFTIDINDINEGPSDVQLTNTAIDENVDGAVVGTLSAVDPDAGDSISYTVSDDRFEVVGNELRVKAGVSFDHETTDAVDVTVTATDSGGLTSDQDFTIDINDINEGPSDVQLTNTSVDENVDGAVVGTLSAVDPDAGDSVSYTVSDDRFEVVGNELRVKAGVSFDHETTDAVDVTVTATDSGGLTSDQDFTIDINDINEGPSDVQLTNTAIDENVDGAVVGTLSAVDPDAGDSISYTVSDDRFEVVGNELRVKAGVSFDHETTDAVDVTVTATDSGGLTSDQDFTIDINDINEGPSDVQLTNTSVDENVDGAVVGTLSAVDPDAGDSISYTVSDDRFEVVGNELRVKAGGSFDHETTDAVDVTVTATDSGGLTSDQDFTIDINDVNEGPSDVQLTNTAINENVDGAVVGTLSAVDPDAGDSISYTVSDDRFEVVGNELRVKAGGSFDHETTDVVDVTVTATDSGGLTSDQDFTIDINDINEGPSDVQLTNTAIDENVDGAVVGTLSAVDPDAGDSISYTVSDDRFEVVGNELRVKAGVSFDHETTDSVDVTVTATDSGGLTSDQDFTIDINDINEGPSDVQLTNTAIDENVDGAVVGTLSAVDPDAGDSISYTVSDDRFEVVGNELRVKAGVSFDHETTDAVDVTVTATDSGGLTSDQDFTIDINDINEGPSDVQLTNTSVDENVDGAVVGTLSAVDPDAGDTISYTVSDDRFEVVGNELRVKAGVSFDHETTDAVDVTVTATDSGGLTSDQDFTIDINDINEGPSDVQLTNTAIDENVDGAVVGTLSAVDPDAGDSISYIVSDDRFEVVGNELRVKAGVSFDHETTDAVDVTVTATDSGGLTSDQDFTIDINDINEGPSDVQLTNTSVDENVDGAVVGTLSAVDPDAGDTISYTVSDDRFEVVGNELRVKAGVSFDHETTDAVDVTVTATDSGGLTSDQDFTIDINDINEGPSDVQLTNTSVDENVDGAVVGTLSAVDPDAGDTISYTVSDDRFEVVGNELRVKAGVSFDHETTDAVDVTVTATDSGGLTSDQDFTIDINDINEGPSDVQLTNTAIDENVDGAVVGTLSAVDPDAGDSISYIVSDDRFEVVGNELRVKAGVSFDHENTDAVDVTVTATDSGGLTSDQDFTIDINDINEAPTDIAISGTSVDENDSGAVIGQLSTTDQDAGDTAGYTITEDNSGLFEIVGNELKLKDGVSLDYETQTSYDLTVEVTDGGGNVYSEAITVDVNDLTEANLIIGTNGKDRLNGTNEADEIRGLDGDDRIKGGGGDDLIIGGEGDDNLSGGGGNDTFRVSGTDDGFDRIKGNRGDDRIEAGEDNTQIGLSKFDNDVETISANGFDNVTIVGDDGKTTFDFSDTTLDGIAGIDGGGGNDKITGSAGDDVIFGGEGKDEIDGGDGNDIIAGGAGDDELSGGDGDDIFTYQIGDGSDEIDGGSGGWTDTIQLSDGDAPLGEYGVDWTISIEEGSIESVSSDNITLSNDAEGEIIFSDGSTIEFTNIEEVTF